MSQKNSSNSFINLKNYEGSTEKMQLVSKISQEDDSPEKLPQKPSINEQDLNESRSASQITLNSRKRKHDTEPNSEDDCDDEPSESKVIYYNNLLNL